MSYARAAIVILVLAFARTGSGSGTQFSVSVIVTGAPASDEEVAIRVTATKKDAPGTPVSCEAHWSEGQARALMELDPSTTWTLQATAPGYYSPPQLVLPERDAVAQVRLWTTGTVAGTLAMPDRSPVPGPPVIRFGPAPGAEGAEAIPRGKSDCAIDASRFRCPLPAGLADYDIHVPGFQSHYRWGERIVPRTTRDIGSISLVRGASVVGRVALAGRERSGDADCRVSLAPRTGGGAFAPEAQPERLRRTAPVNARGFFQFDGVPPGGYVVTALCKGYLATGTAIDVIRTYEAELLEALVVRPPRPFKVAILPATDPSGSAWVIELVESSSQHMRLVARGAVGADGRWATEQCSEGVRYLFSVKAANGDSYWSETLEIGPTTSEHTLNLETIPVHGIARIGRKPLPATLKFGGSSGSVSISTESDHEGRFTVMLPRPGEWTVFVSAESPAVRRDVKASVEPALPGEPASCRIALPNTVIAGEIVDERGRPAETAILTSSGADGMLRQDTVRGGIFQLEGFPPGTLDLRAQAREGDSDVERVEVVGEADPHSVRLVLRPRREIGGRVTDPSGVGVPGALLVPFPAVDTSVTFLPRAVTDAEGAFRLTVPPGAREIRLLVVAPGFSLRALRQEVRPGEELFLVVEQTGGTLSVRMPARIADRARGEIPYVFHNGCFFPLEVLAHVGWAARSLDKQFVVTTSPMEIGDYSVCLVAASQLPAASLGATGVCRHGTVTPFSTTALDLFSPPTPR